MTSEVEIVEHVDDVVHAVLVAPAQVVQNANLDQRLVMEALLIPFFKKKQKKKKIMMKLAYFGFRSH